MLNYQGLVAIHLGDHQRATTHLKRVLPLHREQGDGHGVGWALCYLAIIRHQQGDDTQAVALYEESLSVFQELGDKYGIGAQLAKLAYLAWEQGDDRQAVRLYRESLLERRALQDRYGFADCFEGLAMTAAGKQPERAARLLGAAHTLREAIGMPYAEEGWRSALNRTTAAVQAALGADTFAAAWAEGQALPLEAVIALALEDAAADVTCLGPPESGQKGGVDGEA